MTSISLSFQVVVFRCSDICFKEIYYCFCQFNHQCVWNDMLSLQPSEVQQVSRE